MSQYEIRTGAERVVRYHRNAITDLPEFPGVERCVRGLKYIVWPIGEFSCCSASDVWPTETDHAVTGRLLWCCNHTADPCVPHFTEKAGATYVV
jgi:hypothetical protein